MSTYLRKSFAVEAVQVREPKFITTRDGEVFAHVTDWIVTEASGDIHVCSDFIFKLKFELASPPAGKVPEREKKR